MAGVMEEVEAIGLGLDSGQSVAAGAYVQNMYLRAGNWKVREGFGQLAQFDTTICPGSTLQRIGYTQHMGTHTMLTDFGHVQHVSVFSGLVRSGSAGERGQWGQIFCVSVYDETTGDRWEEPLFRHTSGNNPNSFSMMDWRGHFETGRENTFASNADNFDATVAASSDGPVFFCEYRDYLMFGSRVMGLWCYAPASFGGARLMMLDGIRRREAYEGYSESSRVLPIVANNGLFADAYAYFTAAGFPSPQDVCSAAGRLIMGAGRDLYFSDIGRPGSIMGANVLSIPMEGEITAIAEQFGNILVFGEAETWLYRLPTGSALLTAGDLVRLSATIGCPNPQAKCKARDATVWADTHGFYRATGNYQIEVISARVERLFLDGIPNPLLHFYQTTQVGYTGTDAQHQRMLFRWVEVARLNLCYDDKDGLLFACNPDEGFTLCCALDEGAWSVWTYVSMVQATAATVGVTTTVNARAMTCKDGEVYCIGGMDNYTADDATLREGDPAQPVESDFMSASYYLLQRGRGGGLDRSVEAQEDNRIFTGGYAVINGVSANLAYFLLDQLIPVPPGYVLPQGEVIGANGGFLLPILISPEPFTANVQQPEALHLQFTFDSAHWRPRIVAGGIAARIDAILPPERLASGIGWGLIAPVAAVNEVRVYRAGVADPTGNEIRIHWSGVAGAPFDNSPRMNLPSRGLFPLIYLPLERVAATIADTVTSFGIGAGGGATMMAQQARPSVPATANIGIWAWSPTDARNKNAADNQAAPVDWVFKTGQFGFDSPYQTRLRGIYISLMGRGRGTPLVAGWLYGLLNTVTSSDWKDFSAQIQDFSAFQNVRQAKAGLRLRFLNALTAQATKTWNNSATWGESGTPATGNLLIDDEELDTAAVSEGVKGEHVSTMLFGHIQDRAESILLRSVKLALQAAGGRRRRGR